MVDKNPYKSKSQRALNREARATGILANDSNQPAGSIQSTSRSERNRQATIFIQQAVERNNSAQLINTDQIISRNLLEQRKEDSNHNYDYSEFHHSCRIPAALRRTCRSREAAAAKLGAIFSL